MKLAEEHGEDKAPLQVNPHDATLASLCHLACEKFGHPTFEVHTMKRLSNWLMASHKMTREQVLVCRLDRIVKLMRGEGEPLTEQQQREFDYICEHGPVVGKEICNQLGLPSLSAFTRHDVPKLKEKGIRNRRGAGYFYPS